MFKDFIVEKIGREVRFLEQLRYRNITAVKELTATEEPKDFTYPGFIKPGKASKKINIGEFWSGRDRYLWIHTEFETPKEWKGKDTLGFFDFGLTGGGHNSGFESLLFIDGEPYQGVDSNHREVFFKSQAGKKMTFDFRLWSGLEGGGPKRIMDHQIKAAFFCTLEPAVDELYYLLKNMVLTVKELKSEDPAQTKLQNILTEGYKFLDFTNPGSEAFIASVGKALEYYRKNLKALGRQKDVSVSFIGHTHIDLSWLWRYKHTREKGERSFSTVLRLMERYPEYIFLQTQAQIYDSIKEDHPDLYKAIAKRVAEGRWEASGSMWVEADCNIPSGESLVRQILYGKGFFKREFGVDNTFLWLPDVFGYNWALPQILKKSGIDTFITTKISWSEINRMPHDTFKWTGMDGSSVLTHFITTPDTGNAIYYTYNGMILPSTVKGIWETYRDKAGTKSEEYHIFAAPARAVVPFGKSTGIGVIFDKCRKAEFIFQHFYDIYVIPAGKIRGRLNNPLVAVQGAAAGNTKSPDSIFTLFGYKGFNFGKYIIQSLFKIPVRRKGFFAHYLSLSTAQRDRGFSTAYVNSNINFLITHLNSPFDDLLTD
ncbi:hypothetical protein FACS189447_07110 [Spirochaetia bacterium]|nr:hypothetical protein FACS189447_07110 [Spirochaetia bacterium]